MRMRLPKPKKVFEEIRKKARRPFPTEEVSGTNGVPKGAAGRKAAGKMVPRKEAREEAPGRQAPRAEVFSQEVRKEAPRNDTSRHETPRMDGLGHDALRKVKPTHVEPTLDDEHYAALLSGDGKALHDILDHGRRASQRPSSANPRRNHMDDVHVENGAEAPTRDVAPPERSDTSSVQDRRPRAGGTLKRAKQSGIMRKVSSVPLRGASFRNASFDGATFDGASFDNACFDGACFNGGSFNNASFDGATFDGARFYGGSFHGASFNGASFKGASFEGASFGQKGTNEVEDGHSITAEDHHIVTPKDRHSPTTEDLDHIYQDRHDESDVLKDSERHLQPEPRVDDTSADAVVISKVPKLDHVQIPNGDMPADDFVSSKELKLNEAPCTLESNDDITIIKKIIPKDSEKKVQLQTRDGDKSADVVVNDKELKHNQALHKIVRHDDNTIIEDHSHLNGSVKDAVVSKEPLEPQVQLEIGSKAGSIIGSKAGTRTITSSEYVQDDGIPPLQLNYDALKHVATHFMPGSHGACVDITEMERGSFHEIRALIFEDGWSCIGRFTRVQETLAKTESELATLRYVGKHTRIPIPEIYFVNYNSNHVVGAAFVLMERLQGCSLAEIWRDLSMEHKLIAMEQIAHVVGELATLRFDRIGSLTGDGTIGPLINISQAEGESPVGPFGNFIDCVDATLDETRRHGPQKAMDLYPALRQEMRAFLALEDLDKVLQPPYRLTHVDLQTRNILVKCENDQEGPKITGVIDWDWAFAGPSYYLYEHIEEVTDLQKSESELPLAKSLRKHFVKTLLQRLPKDSPERDVVKQCFRKKTLELTEFSRQIRWPFTYDDEEFGAVYSHLFVFQGNLHVRDRHPYFAVDMEWKPDTDNEEDDGKDDDVDDRDDEE